ncbi:hypothetical protein [Paraglaciecola chathamensis]|uniref:hypothetical protein n=1 Tax=Paraglaciecola chathamensis TaxID=368405 RepID=UPI000A077011|nr:hypothetical protein [Paraglaciecola agarilytica]
MTYYRLQFSIFEVGLPDALTGMSGQGEVIYMDVTFRRSGTEVGFKYGSKKLAGGGFFTSGYPCPTCCAPFFERSKLFPTTLSGDSFLAVEERVTRTSWMRFETQHGCW